MPLAAAQLALGEVVNDSEEDAEGEEEDEEMAVAESLAPPGVSVTTTTATIASSSTNGTRTADPSVTASPALLPTGNPNASLLATTGTHSQTVSPSPAPAGPAPATISPSLLAPPSAPVTVSPQPPAPAIPYVPVPPYHSLFGIHEISSDYTSELPPVPHPILRNRLNMSLSLKNNSKKGTKSIEPAPPSHGLQPDLYKLHVRAQHMGAKSFLGPGKRVHNALSTREWDVGIDEMRAIRAFERIEQLKQDRGWSFRQLKKQRVGVAPKAHWDHLLDEMVRLAPLTCSYLEHPTHILCPAALAPDRLPPGNAVEGGHGLQGRASVPDVPSRLARRAPALARADTTAARVERRRACRAVGRPCGCG